MSMKIVVEHDAGLVAVLDALRVPWTECRPANGCRATIEVPVDEDLDQRLEDLIACLASLRWQYTPGRTLQLELPGWDDGTD